MKPLVLLRIIVGFSNVTSVKVSPLDAKGFDPSFAKADHIMRSSQKPWTPPTEARLCMLLALCLIGAVSRKKMETQTRKILGGEVV